MFIDYEKHRAEIFLRHLKESDLLRAKGIAESDVNSILALDNHELYSDKKFYGGLDKYLDPQHTRVMPSEGAPESGLDFMDEIENPTLYAAMQNLRPQDRELVILHAVEGLSLKEIAETWNEPYAKIQRAYRRAIEKVKKYFPKPV